MNEFSRDLYEYSAADRPSVGGGPPAAPWLSLRAWAVDGLFAASFSNGPLLTRTVGRTGDGAIDSLFVRIVLKGRVLAESDGAETVLRAGKIHLMHPQNTLRPIDDCLSLSLRLPFESVAFDPRRHPRFTSYDAETATGRIVMSGITALFEALPTMTKAETRGAASTIAGLMQCLVGHSTPSEPAVAALRDTRVAAMHRYVRANLRDPGLNAEKLQTVFHASRPTVYRAFRDVGGVARFILEERLTAVFRDLSLARPERGLVGRISESYCFMDRGSFSKAFTRYHGVRPVDVVGCSRWQDRRPERARPGRSLLGDQQSLASFWQSSGMRHA